MDQALEKRIRASFETQAMMQTFGAEVVSVLQGEVVLRAPILPLALQHTGHGHAALTFALGDTAAGFAAATYLPEDAAVVTAEIKINLLAPAAGDHLIATGRVIKPGRRLIVVTATVAAYTDGVARDVAILQGTMVGT
ncbi:hypothetical protein OB2597_15705 [Pseudooceanicola batsensis HTCC2597]|uniref:Thioesterase domain-containing protein n=1 Tax=Pseudooceanicola batsensis (strain ATCC BAA-863 / DSM 15984 / KCTC 12145 / HTCC2597) TaxID=252305 RepID=A3TZ23_PSEBH|nr:PaaI family thioesterase [Pseudooceanicola batsensis]EAQ02841.1 hypothetical protein OB2597_15705 [Pseudooceanicola batsensis HTCC2597]